MNNNRICLGLNDNLKKFNKSKFEKIIKKALSLGCKFIDTADTYYNGQLNELIKKSLNKNRKKINIINKFQLVEKEKIMENLNRTLKKFNTDFIDIYMPHWPSAYFEPELMCEQAEKMIKQGKIRFFGLSNFNLKLVKQFKKFYKRKIFIQNEININNFYSVKDLIEYSKRENIDIFSYSINNNFPKYNNLLEREKKIKKINDYEFSLYWLKSFCNLIPIVRTKNVSRLIKNFKIINNKIVLQKKPFHYCKNNFKFININRIRKINSESGIVYNSLAEAKINKFKLFPSPALISKEIEKFGLLKPFYVQKRKNDKDFNLISGQARFWAYQIAFKKKDSIPAIIIE
tara:strand:- start:2272 stop:3306 length:1035 start_codon:yes stop_codon:yes gene_type:complete